MQANIDRRTAICWVAARSVACRYLLIHGDLSDYERKAMKQLSTVI